MKNILGGFFGMFGKKTPAEITEIVPENISEEISKESSDLAKEGLTFLEKLVSIMELSIEPKIVGENSFSLEGSDSAIIVGRHGDTLKGLEYLLNLCLRETRDVPRLRVDSDGYHERREESLTRLAASSARKAIERGTPVRLDPMASWERRIIHVALKDHKDVTTESVGESPERKVVIMPKVNPHENDRARPKRKYRR